MVKELDNINVVGGTIDGLNFTINGGTANIVKAKEYITSGKWYWEVIYLSGDNPLIGIVNESGAYRVAESRFIVSNTRKLSNITYSTYGDVISNGDVVSVLLDADNKQLEFWINGISQGIAFTDLSSFTKIYPAMGISTTTSTSSWSGSINFGATPLLYAIPNGYSTLDKMFSNKILLLSNDETYSIKKGEYKKESSIPIMTSNTTPSGIAKVSASSGNNYPAWKAFDGSTTDTYSYWLTPNGTTTGWVSYEFDSPKIIKKYSMSPFNHSAGKNRIPRDWTFEGSNDEINWTVLDKQMNITSWNPNQYNEFEINNNNEYKIYRLNITANNGDSYLAISEIKMYESFDDIVYKVANHSEQNLIKYGMDSPVQVDGIFSNKNYILQDTVSENTEGLWSTQINRKPLSIKFN